MNEEFIMKVLQALDKQVAELKAEVTLIKDKLDEIATRTLPSMYPTKEMRELIEPEEPEPEPLPFVPASFSFEIGTGKGKTIQHEPPQLSREPRRQEIIGAAQPFLEGLSSMFATRKSEDIHSSPERQMTSEEKKQKLTAFLNGKLCQQCGKEVERVFGEIKFGKKMCKKCYYEANGNKMMNNYGKIADFCINEQNCKEFLDLYSKLRHAPGLIDGSQKQKILDYLESKGLDVKSQKNPNTFIDRFYNKIVFNEMAKKLGANAGLGVAADQSGQTNNDGTKEKQQPN